MSFFWLQPFCSFYNWHFEILYKIVVSKGKEFNIHDEFLWLFIQFVTIFECCKIISNCVLKILENNSYWHISKNVPSLIKYANNIKFSLGVILRNSWKFNEIDWSVGGRCDEIQCLSEQLPGIVIVKFELYFCQLKYQLQIGHFFVVIVNCLKNFREYLGIRNIQTSPKKCKDYF